MNACNYKVLVIATSRKSKGGINSVIKAYSSNELWNQWNCYWLETHIDRSRWLKVLFLLRALILFIFKIPFYQIVHIHLSEVPSAIRKSVFIKISKLLNKIIIVHFHSFSTDTTIDGNHQQLYYKIFHSSDKLIVLSKSWENWIIEKWPLLKDKIKVLNNPCIKVAEDSYLPKVKTILFAGMLNERKGYTDLIEGFARTKACKKDWKLILAGNGDIDKGQLLANKLNISEKVIFTGWVSGIEKDNLFRTSSIFCLPSYAEGFPMAVLDAWAYGLPVITTPVGGLPDVLENQKNAIIIKPGEPDDIAKALEMLINDEKLREKLSHESLKLSKTIFSLESITQQLDRIYLDSCQV